MKTKMGACVALALLAGCTRPASKAPSAVPSAAPESARLTAKRPVVQAPREPFSERQLSRAQVPESSPALFDSLPVDVRAQATRELATLVSLYRDVFVPIDALTLPRDLDDYFTALNERGARRYEYRARNFRLRAKYGVLGIPLDKALGSIGFTPTPLSGAISAARGAPAAQSDAWLTTIVCGIERPSKYYGDFVTNPCDGETRVSEVISLEYQEVTESEYNIPSCAGAIKKQETHSQSVAAFPVTGQPGAWCTESSGDGYNVCKSTWTYSYTTEYYNVCVVGDPAHNANMLQDYLWTNYWWTNLTQMADCCYEFDSAFHECNRLGAGPFFCGNPNQPPTDPRGDPACDQSGE